MAMQFQTTFFANAHKNFCVLHVMAMHFVRKTVRILNDFNNVLSYQANLKPFHTRATHISFAVTLQSANHMKISIVLSESPLKDCHLPFLIIISSPRVINV